MSCRNPNFSTQYQNFYTEAIDKELNTRLKKYFATKDAETKKSKQLEVFRRKIEEGSKPSEALLGKLPKIVGEKRSYNKKKTDPIDTLVNRAPTTAEFGPTMRPVTPRTKHKLFDGFTKEGKGRYQYLVKRYNKIPEDKFEFPLLSSWEYGWRLGDVIKVDDIKKPAHGRTKTVEDTFYTRNGVPTLDFYSKS